MYMVYDKEYFVYKIHSVICILIYIHLRWQLKGSAILDKLYCNFSSWWAIEVDCLPVTSSSLISLFEKSIKKRPDKKICYYTNEKDIAAYK